MKYKNYKELLEAYKSGELKEPLIMDNDDCFVYVDEECVFRGNGQCDIEKLAQEVGFLVESV